MGIYDFDRGTFRNKINKTMAKYSKEEMEDWFIGKARTAAGYRKNIVSRSPNRERSYTNFGKMYFFFYDPKHKATLPIYDRFPLVIPLGPKENGFLGINLHYLSVSERLSLLSQLRKYASNNKFDKTTRLEVSYDDMINHGMGGFTESSTKHYLYGHVRSPFIEILPNEWDKAAQLNVELFIKKI